MYVKLQNWLKCNQVRGASAKRGCLTPHVSCLETKSSKSIIQLDRATPNGGNEAVLGRQCIVYFNPSLGDDY